MSREKKEKPIKKNRMSFLDRSRGSGAGQEKGRSPKSGTSSEGRKTSGASAASGKGSSKNRTVRRTQSAGYARPGSARPGSTRTDSLRAESIRRSSENPSRGSAMSGNRGTNAGRAARTADGRGREDVRGYGKAGASARMSGKSGAGSRRNASGRRRSAESESREMRAKRIWKLRAAVAGGCIAAVFIIYCLIASTYRDRFLPHTYVNGFDVGKLGSAETEEILKKSVENYQLELGFRGGKNETVTGEEIGLTYVSSNESAHLLAGQNRMGWLPALFGKKNHYTVSTSFRFDSARLRSALEALPEFQEENYSAPRSSGVVLDADLTFRVSDPFLGNMPNEDVIFDAAEAAINASEPRISLDLVENAYVLPAADSQDEDLNARADELNDFLATELTIVYRDGATTVLDRDELVNWVTKSEDGIYYVGEEKIYTKAYALMTAAAEKYNDIKNTLDFKSSYEGVVRLRCSDYGYEINVEDETDRIVYALMNHESGEMEPNNAVPETRDATFGGTYCEVDVTDQVVFYYEDGKLLLSSTCVTGLEYDEERRTPSGIYALLDKQRDTILGSLQSEDPGQRYESHVDYWMPFFESYGMHDASWRGEFGGDIYLEYGSHGCVNLPPSFAAELYNHIEIWTPVIVLRYSDRVPSEETAESSAETVESSAEET